MKVSERIRAALQRHGMTQTDFAVACGIDRAYLNNIINRELDVRVSTLAKIEAAITRLDDAADHVAG